MRGLRGIVCAAALLLAAGCGKSEDNTPEGFHKAVTSAWSDDGLQVGALASVDSKPFGATDCVKGEVSKLVTVLCLYADAEAAKAGATAMEESMGSGVTRVGRAHGRVALGLADEAEADLRGKTIQRLLTLFKASAAP